MSLRRKNHFLERKYIIDKETRTIQLHFYVTEKENEIIKKRMDKPGIINLFHYLREMAINGYVIHMDMNDIKESSRLLSNCANNFNQ